MPKLFHHALLPALIVAFHVAAPGQELGTLADVEGFESNTLYPLGNLQPITHGQAQWAPSAQPPQIVNSGDPEYGKVLRRPQTGTDRTDFLHFPAVSSGVLAISFDARASTAETRTLDVFLHPTSGGETVLLGWGTVTNKLSYYNGTAWIGVLDLDTNWHRIEILNHLGGAQFGSWDLHVDGALVAANLPWRNNHPQGTAYSRLRIGAIRGVSGTHADIDNLVITGELPVAIPDRPVLTNWNFAAETFSFSFHTQPGRDYLVQTTPSLFPAQWQAAGIIGGDGAITDIADNPTNAQQFYRVERLPLAEAPGRNDGYRGIWFTLGQFSEHGDKYSGGLGTYTANHVPMAVYAPEVNKTFFTYGGTIKDQRRLLIMASYYDHATGQVPRPTVVHDKSPVNDPHDNGSICIDEDGYVWIFVSGRSTSRPGFKYRSLTPYSVTEFEFIRQDQMTYPQPWHIPGQGFFHLFTKYTAGRELYWETSPDGVNWSAHQKLAGISGHYQVSNRRGNKVGTFFNRHPGGSVDRRTDLYYLQTEDMGQTWTTAGGAAVAVPLTTTNNPALVIDYASQGRLMYTLDLNFDTNGHPVLLYITSNGHQPGPQNDPRIWTITRWNGTEWITSNVCPSDHNYDMGSLYIREDRWLIIGPTQTGPQSYQTGGEMALWSSEDEGQTWTMMRQITRNSVYNHTYARRPVNATDPFFAFWADGDPTQVTPSRLYFGNSEGTGVWRLPYDMSEPVATPDEVLFAP